MISHSTFKSVWSLCQQQAISIRAWPQAKGTLMTSHMKRILCPGILGNESNPSWIAFLLSSSPALSQTLVAHSESPIIVARRRIGS